MIPFLCFDLDSLLFYKHRLIPLFNWQNRHRIPEAPAIINSHCASGPFLLRTTCKARKTWTLESIYNPKGFTTEYLTLRVYTGGARIVSLPWRSSLRVVMSQTRWGEIFSGKTLWIVYSFKIFPWLVGRPFKRSVYYWNWRIVTKSQNLMFPNTVACKIALACFDSVFLFQSSMPR